jgi:hypothetical protein
MFSFSAAPFLNRKKCIFWYGKKSEIKSIFINRN